MITEDYVSVETAKLLKEKGMNKSCFKHYVQKNNNDGTSEAVAVCTLQMAMKWLREEKHYYIQVMIDNWVGIHVGYFVIIMKTDSDFGLQLYDEEEQVFYATPEEACEAAIKYSLENLI